MNIKKYLFETIKYALRSYPIIRPYIKEVDRLYTMNAEELKQRNEKRFLEIFRRAYDKSPFYHKLYTEEGIRKDPQRAQAEGAGYNRQPPRLHFGRCRRRRPSSGSEYARRKPRFGLKASRVHCPRGDSPDIPQVRLRCCRRAGD